MERRQIRNLALYFDAEEAAAADLVGRACEHSLDLIRDLWELEAPAECRVYVMTSWQRFLFHAAPWPWRIYLALTLPLRYGRIRTVWALAGGWTLRYGQRRVIGIKPPRLLREVDAGLRERIFVRREVGDWVQHNTCHELVHAGSDDLRLPTWLHEGLAMLTVDRFARGATVKTETLGALTGAPPSYRIADGQGLVYLAVRGYWITRYLAEAHPALLKRQLAQRQPHDALEAALAAGLGLKPGAFQRDIDGIVLSYFEEVLAHEDS